MLLLKTSFHLRGDLQWGDLYTKCIYTWINKSEDHNTHIKNYAGLLRILPKKIDVVEKPHEKYGFGADSLSYSHFVLGKDEYLGFDFIYSNQSRKWNVRVVLKRTAKFVLCCVSVSCEVVQSAGIPPISKPRIIDYLLKEFQDDKGDEGYAISNEPKFIENSEADTAINILRGRSKNKLPIVYLSCYEHHALKPREVARKLYGVAHVFAERDKHVGERAGISVKHRFPKGGEIAICYPTHPLLIINRRDDKEWEKKPEILVQDIFRKILRQNIASKSEFSWDDYQAAHTKYLRDLATQEKTNKDGRIATLESLLDAATKEKDAKEDELKSFMAAFDDENKALKKINQNLEEELVQVRAELHAAIEAKKSAEDNIKALKQKSGPTLPLLIPAEPEKYEHEYMNHIVCALKMAAANSKGKSCSTRQRNIDVYNGILEANPEAERDYIAYIKDKEELMTFARKEDLKSAKGQKQMEKFNLEFSRKQNCHGKICYKDDDRYFATESSSSSDKSRGGLNEAAALERAMFCSDK